MGQSKQADSLLNVGGSAKDKIIGNFLDGLVNCFYYKDIKNALIRVSESNCNYSFMWYYNQKGESFTWNKSKAEDIFSFINR